MRCIFDGSTVRQANNKRYDYKGKFEIISSGIRWSAEYYLSRTYAGRATGFIKGEVPGELAARYAADNVVKKVIADLVDEW